jgi:hypothetical protein
LAQQGFLKTGRRRCAAATPGCRGDSGRTALLRNAARMIVENWHHVSGMFQARRAAKRSLMTLAMASELMHRCLWNGAALDFSVILKVSTC